MFRSKGYGNDGSLAGKWPRHGLLHRSEFDSVSAKKGDSKECEWLALLVVVRKKTGKS